MCEEHEGITILFPPGSRSATPEVREQPDAFYDLNLDQLVASITTGREEYDLAPLLYEHLDDLDVVSYRQEVFADLDDAAVLEAVSMFAREMRELRAFEAYVAGLRCRLEQQGALIDVIEHYTKLVAKLSSVLRANEPQGRGMRAIRAYLERYVSSGAFTFLVDDSAKIRGLLAEVHYTVRIRNSRVHVAKYEGEADYSAEVLSTFDRFKQGAAKDYRVGFRVAPQLNHVEANVLELVARLYPEIFSELETYCASHRDYLDATIRRFDREVQFYLGYLEHVAPLERAGLRLCLPEVTRSSKEIFARETFDLVLAAKLVAEGRNVVVNDLELRDPERIVVVSGPNQGGKSTFARLFGQLHHLAGIGCPVPGSSARLYAFDRLYAHFEREESLEDMTGKLEDDLLRVRKILRGATRDSIIVLNELFSSTTLQDSVFLSTRLMERLVALDALAVYVTFLDELGTFAPTTVSMMATVVPDNPAERTYKIVRRPADGLAYALAIAERYGLTDEQIRARMRR